MVQIDLIKFGKLVLAGYGIRHCPSNELNTHSWNGYSIEAFDSVDEAKAYYGEYFPEANLREC